MGAIEKAVDAVAAKVGAACQLVVICGRNKRLIARLRAKCVLSSRSFCTARLAALSVLPLLGDRRSILREPLAGLDDRAPAEFNTLACSSLMAR